MAVLPVMVFAYNHPSQKAAIYAELDSQSVITFAIQATKDSPIRGTELFRRMMIAFGDESNPRRLDERRRSEHQH